MATDESGATRRYLLPSGIELAITVADERAMHDELERYLLPHCTRAPQHEKTREEWHIEARRVLHLAHPDESAATPFQSEPGSPGHASQIVPADGGAFNMYDADAAIRTYCNPARRSLMIEAEADVSRYRLVQAVYATARLLLLASIADRCGRVLHAGAVAIGNAAVVIVGEKGAGKTTLVSALLAEGAAYIGSDRLFLWREAHTPVVAGWPCTYRLDPAGLPLVFDGATLRRLHNLIEQNAADPNYSFAGKFRFPPGDFLNALRCTALPRAHVAMMVELVAADERPCRVEESSQPVQDACTLVERHTVRYDLPPGFNVQPPHDVPAEGEEIIVLRMHGRSDPRQMARDLRARLECLMSTHVPHVR